MEKARCGFDCCESWRHAELILFIFLNYMYQKIVYTPSLNAAHSCCWCLMCAQLGRISTCTLSSAGMDGYSAEMSWNNRQPARFKQGGVDRQSCIYRFIVLIDNQHRFCSLVSESCFNTFNSLLSSCFNNRLLSSCWSSPASPG